MDPLDHLLALPDGLRCTVCEERVPATRVKLLARRDDLLFLQIECPACGSTSLGFIADERVEWETERLDRGAVVSSDDVLDMHAFLEEWTGDLASLVRAPSGRRFGPALPGDRRAGRSA